jgi:dipeptidyl aminopeptidase/acylaminoacyl peptidase
MDKHMITAPYGEWPSPISARDVAQSGVPLGFAHRAGDAVWWQEGLPHEGGRVTVVRDGTALLPAPWNARSRVHEYGGRSYLPLDDGGFVFTNFADQRLYRVAGGSGSGSGEPEPLTPEGGDRYADMVASPDGAEIWCVRERHADGAVSRAIVAVPLASAGPVRELVRGSDFFAFPTPSPDGRLLAWISWDHPRMPWDGSALWVAPLADPSDRTLVMGGPAEAVLAPAWRDNEHIYAVSDISGWWNLYLAGLDGSAPRPLCPREEEFAGPLWQLGGSPFAVLGDGRLAVLHGRGELRLGVLDPGSGTLTDLDLPYRAFGGGVSAAGMTVATVAGGPADPWSVIGVDMAAGSVSVLRANPAPVTDRRWLPAPETLTIGQNGHAVHALVYPPASPDARAPEGELPPYIVWVHGGPTSHAVPVVDPKKAYFTSRGIGIVDLNYGGSSGYGRAYRERLRGEWGVTDVADAYALAAALVDAGRADGKRLGICGGSAGGWTVLAAVTSGLPLAGPARFAAAVSYYGVCDLRTLAADTHDFESRYLDGLVGPLPSADATFTQRSPLGHVSTDTSPVLLLQGLDDPVVPPAQSEAIAAELARRDITYAYVAFSGESHGFRGTETIVAALEAELSFYGQVMGFAPPGVPELPLT